MKTLIFDNGAYEVKTGFVGTKAVSVPNCIARSKGDRRVYAGEKLRNCKDYGALGFKRAFDQGYLTSWETEKAIWDTILFDGEIAVDPAETSLLVTEPVLDLPILQTSYDQIVFEEYGFQSYCRTTAPSLVVWHRDIRGSLQLAECVLVVDCGFSFTHVTPVVNGRVIWSAIKRLNIGGKFLTNYLKEVISYRQYNMMEETYLINTVKEKCCFVSQDFSADLERIKFKKGGEVKYVLPDYTNNKEGYVLQEGKTVQENQQALVLGNERFAIPELLFTPSDIRLEQGGLAEAVLKSVSAMPEELRSLLLANIVLVGGTCKLPGLLERLRKEVRSIAPMNCLVRITMPTDPISCAWEGGSALAGDKNVYATKVVTKKEYMEHGSNICSTRFDCPKSTQESSGKELIEDDDMY